MRTTLEGKPHDAKLVYQVGPPLAASSFAKCSPARRNETVYTAEPGADLEKGLFGLYIADAAKSLDGFVGELGHYLSVVVCDGCLQSEDTLLY